jgi:hypothetical protein
MEKIVLAHSALFLIFWEKLALIATINAKDVLVTGPLATLVLPPGFTTLLCVLVLMESLKIKSILNV